MFQVRDGSGSDKRRDPLTAGTVDSISRTSRASTFLFVVALVFGLCGARDAESSSLRSMRKIADNGGRCAWSPAGDDRIAFDRKNPADGYYDLWVMNADGSHQVCLTAAPPPGFPSRHAGNPSWHPSGKFILVNAEKEANPTVGKKFLRGYHVTDADGIARLRRDDLSGQRRRWHLRQ